MPVFALTDELVFPDPSQAEPDGLLALGGDLRPERLLLAYAHGIFPWNSEDEPLLWWSPAPRAVLVPGEIAVPRSLAKAIRRRRYRISLDLSFEAVIAACAETPRPGQDRTWITPGIRAAFTDLHRRGLAHSVEAWDGDRLVGGLYGLALGSVFCGESMFARADDASKIAFVALAEQLRRWEFSLIDCQVETAHLHRFGATPVERAEFMRRLSAAVARPWRVGVWTLDEDLAGRAEGGPPPRKAPPPVMWRLSRETDEEKGKRVEEGARSRRRRRDANRGGEAPAAREAVVGMTRETGEAARSAAAAEMARGTGEAQEAEQTGRGEAAGAGEMARGTGEASVGEEAGRGEAAGAGEIAGATGLGRDREAGRETGTHGEALGEMSQETGAGGSRGGGE
nr:leucyl/phenylalanyl-tRNA--protein transferase [Nannocystis sp. RBIL2]